MHLANKVDGMADSGEEANRKGEEFNRTGYFADKRQKEIQTFGDEDKGDHHSHIMTEPDPHQSSTSDFGTEGEEGTDDRDDQVETETKTRESLADESLVGDSSPANESSEEPKKNRIEPIPKSEGEFNCHKHLSGDTCRGSTLPPICL